MAKSTTGAKLEPCSGSDLNRSLGPGPGRSLRPEGRRLCSFRSALKMEKEAAGGMAAPFSVTSSDYLNQTSKRFWGAFCEGLVSGGKAPVEEFLTTFRVAVFHL
jgi:hypothetical protein